MNLADILKDSNYKLSQFRQEEINWLEESIFLKQTKKGDTPYVKCLVRNKDIQLKPEEAIRQLYLKVLHDRYGYPLAQMIVEYPVKFGRETKKADIAIMDRDRPTVVYAIVELKKPKEKDGKDQLKSYCNGTGAPIGVWTNGDSISRWHRKDPNYFERITDIPKATQTLEDILQIKFTLEDLIKNDRLVQEKKSLRSLIEEMEDEVLANAGVDVFEEVFKLIFTKLYDEWLSGQGKNHSTRLLEFRNTGQTEGALKNKIQSLFDKAKQKWEGIFSEDSKITLTPSHLAVCVRSIENVKLFNSNLDVVDEAFEYLINQSSKGEKGQYFTPRYVIDQKLKEKVELTRLEKLLTFNQRGKQPNYLDRDENPSIGLPVINSKHVREGEVIFNDNRYGEYPNGNNSLIIQTNDLLINGTGVGTIGRCAPYLHQQNALPDNHVAILRTALLDPVYLSIYINSIAGQLQV